MLVCGVPQGSVLGQSYSCSIQLTSSLLSSAMVFALTCMPIIRKCTAHVASQNWIRSDARS